MTTVNLLLPAVTAFNGFNGLPLVGGLLNTYQAGTTTPVATYADSLAVTALSNPIVLNAYGAPSIASGASTEVWGIQGQAYKLVLTDALSNVIWTADNVTAPATITSLAPNLSFYGVDSGTANAYAIAAVGATLTTGTMIRFNPLNANTGASTIALNGGATQTLVGQGGTTLRGGELTVLGPAFIQWTGSVWQIVATAANLANVLDFGADPTGAASSVTAFNNAFNAAMAVTPHAAIYLPRGKYQVPSSAPLSWTNQNDIFVYGDGMHSTQLILSGSNYTILTISADTGHGTTGLNVTLRDFSIIANTGTGVSALSLSDYGQFSLTNMQLYASGNALTLAGMAWGAITNVNCLTAGTNAAGNTALKLTTDTASIACGPLSFDSCQFNGQSNVTAGGAMVSQKTFSAMFKACGFIAFGSALTSVIEASNADDLTFIAPYCEGSYNTGASTANWLNAGSTSACLNITIIGGTLFSQSTPFSLKYAVNCVNTQALKVQNVIIANFATAAIKYANLGQASLVAIENVYSSGTGNPPALDSSIADAPTSGYLKSWHDPWPRADVSLASTVPTVTGNAAPYTVLFDTKNFDSISNYSTGTGIFTVGSQSGGMYDVSAAVMVNNLTAANTNYEMDIIQQTSGGGGVSTHAVSINAGAVRNAANQCSLSQNCLLKCSAGDKIFVQVTVSGGAGNSVGVVGAATEFTRMCVRYLG